MSSSSSSSALERALTEVARGQGVGTGDLVAALRCATDVLATESSPVRHVAGEAVVVIGPTHGHAVDLAEVLLQRVLCRPGGAPQAIVFLGNYIDGGSQSCEVLYIVALLILHLRKDVAVVALAGERELQFTGEALSGPSDAPFGSTLRDEIRLRAAQLERCGPGAGGPRREHMEVVFATLFAQLPLCCVVNSHYFCAAGGLSAELPFVTGGAPAAVPRKHAVGCALNAYVGDAHALADGAPRGLYFQPRVPSDAAGGVDYTFNAVCNFLSRNGLLSVVCGYRLHHLLAGPTASRAAGSPGVDPLPTYDAGYRLHREHPRTRAPSSISLLSAAHFCGVRHNHGALLWISSGSATVVVEPFTASAARPLTIPARVDHAFAWSLPLVAELAVAFVGEVLRGRIEPPSADAATDACRRSSTSQPANEEGVVKVEPPGEADHEAAVVAKFRLLCLALKGAGLPLPVL